MIAWFENIKTFLLNHYKQILLLLTPANVAAMITAIVMVIKNHKSAKRNTVIGTSLVNSMDKVDGLQETVKANTDVVTCQIESVQELSNKYMDLSLKIANVEQNLTDKFDIIDQRLDAMLSVQAMVYNTIQNDDLRINVQNIIANAKLVTDNTRTELKKQIDTLKGEINTIVDTASKKINEVSENLDNSIDVTKKKNRRY